MRWIGLTVILSMAYGGEPRPAPSWTKAPTQLNGKRLVVVSNATGPDLSTARIAALANCRSEASEYVSKDVEVKNFTVSTNTDEQLFKSISSHNKIANLDCQPRKEFSETVDDQVSVWIQYVCDLSKTRVVKANGSNENKADTMLQDGDAAPPEVETPEPQRYVRSASREISISTIPKADSLLIQGNHPRSIRFKENPMIVHIDQKDTEITALLKGYKPKVVNLKENRMPSGDQQTEGLEIFFEK